MPYGRTLVSGDFPAFSQPKLVLSLVTLQGCKAKLTWLVVISHDSSPAEKYLRNNQAVSCPGIEPVTKSRKSKVLTTTPPSHYQCCGVCRYFQCVPTFGLFAPLSKVTRAVSSSVRRGSGSVSRIPVGTSLILSRERSGSQESLSSVGSVTSNVSRSRLRLGVTSLAGQVCHHWSPTNILGMLNKV